MKHIYKDINILVVGDSCIDVYTYGNVTRLAPEGPAPVFNPTNTKNNGGMASNVHSNIQAIGANSYLLTHEENITKTRFVDQRTNTLLMRIDSNDKASKIPENVLKNIINNTFFDYAFDALIISDYCKGFLSESDIQEISSKNKNVFLDTKKILGKWCTYCDFIKINHEEYDKTIHTIDFLDLHEKLIITRSQDGCEFRKKIFPVEKVEIKDVSGAGDTFISGLACEYIRTKDIVKAIRFAQDCASIVVQKKGVCTV